MRSGGGGNKGAAFERLNARKLSMWMSKGQRDDLLWRSSMSGGRATLRLRSGAVNLAQSGDLSAISSEAWKLIERYFIELKSYRDLHIAQAITKGTGNLASFWKTAVVEADKYRKYPLLIAKQNRYPTIALVKRSDPLFEHVPALAIMLGWDAKIFQFDAAVSEGSPSLFTDEIWKPIPGWDEHYVSSLGRVRSGTAVLDSMPSSPRYIYLREGEHHCKESIARLVLLAFVGLPPPGKPLACHLDDDVRNNTIWNVAWGSRRDNALDAYRNGKVDLVTKNARISASHLDPEYQTAWRAKQPKQKQNDPSLIEPATEIMRPRIKRPNTLKVAAE